MDSRRGITLSRDQLEAWARRPLSDEEVEAIDDCSRTPRYRMPLM